MVRERKERKQVRGRAAAATHSSVLHPRGKLPYAQDTKLLVISWNLLVPRMQEKL